MFTNDRKKYSGTKLYKYYSYNDCICDMFAPVLNNTLRYRSPFLLNDPYDCYISSNINGKIQSIGNSEMETVHVCSMTKTCDNLLMWAHYASSHCGYVVEYDVEKLKKMKGWQIEEFSEVEYSDDVVQHDLLNFSKTEEKILWAIFHKHLCWCYEQEVRSACYDSPGIDFKDFVLPDNAVTAIYLGSHFIAKRKGKIPFFLKEWHENKQLFYMQLASSEYKVEPKRIEDAWFDENYLTWGV
ncbi:MAG: DUF2971 domain-containing protein [Treponema sp.]|nr:DUF2971 domain-containing protein [Treponema sp.]